MKKLQEYIIPFSGLKEGIHEFIFKADDRFFEYFENPEVRGGMLTVRINLIKNNTFIELLFTISGTLKIICDRCLEEFHAEVYAEETLFIRFGDDFEELEDNVIIIPRDEKRIDVSQYIYEYAVLNLPLRRVHPNDINGKPQCNVKMLEIIEKHTIKNPVLKDPVWDILKDLIN